MAVALTIPAYGHPFTIGALYDYQRSQIIPGIKLITQQQQKDMLVVTENVSMETDIRTEESMEGTNSDLAMSGNLSLSILSGALKVSGSGSHQVKSTDKKETESVIYRLKVHSKHEELHFPPDLKLADTGRFRDATHVVAGIQYGGTALFYFERNKEASTNNSKTSGSLTVEISAFASLLSVSGASSLNVSSDETKSMQKIRVAYKGDFHLASPPTNFVDAMKCIQSIQGAEARSPLTVTLVPLSMLIAEIPPEPMPLPLNLMTKAVGCYETLNGALATLSTVLGKLRSTFWSQVVKKLEAEMRELNSFKASLNDAVFEALQKQAAKSAEKKLSGLNEKISLFDSGSKYAHLKEWADAVYDTGNVLFAISERFQTVGVQVISDQAERARFVMGSLTGEPRTLYSLTCPIVTFEIQGFDHEIGLKLWNDQKHETQFFLDLIKLVSATEFLHLTSPLPGMKKRPDLSHLAVEQSEQSKTANKGSGIQLTSERLNSGRQ